MTGTIHEELKYDELFEITRVRPDFKIVEYNGTFCPRIIKSNFIEEINYFSRQNDDLFYTVCLEQTLQSSRNSFKKKYFYSPSSTLIATLMRSNTDEIKELLGINDNLSSADTNIINKIVRSLSAASLLGYYREHKEEGNNAALIKKYSYLEEKELNYVILKLNDVDAYFSGQGFNGKVKSKSEKDKIYNIFGKNFISFDGQELEIPNVLSLRCGCGLSAASNTKYEYDEILLMADIHTELYRQKLSYPELFRGRAEFYEEPDGRVLEKVENIFTPFNLDNPAAQTGNDGKILRAILRRAIYAFVCSQNKIKESYGFTKDHKRTGNTIYRGELDADLLSHTQTYNKDFLRLWTSNLNQELSEKKTCQLFGDYVKVGTYRNDNIRHYKDKKKGTIFHKNGWDTEVVEHWARRLSDGIEAKLRDDQIRHNNSMDHELSGLRINDYEIFHASNVYEPRINFTQPLKAANVDGINIFITPYKMKKSKRLN